MPAKNHTKHPQHVIDAAVKRYFNGESVSVLAKLYTMSKAGVYGWIKKHKKVLLENAARADMTPRAVDAAEVRDLRLQVQAERAEKLRLQQKVCELMLKTGDFSYLSDR